MLAYRKDVKRKWITGLASAALLLGTLLFPVSYYLYEPGTIEPLQPMVAVENGHKSGEGSLNLSTVLSLKAEHLYEVLYGLAAPDTRVRKAEEVSGNLTAEEYDLLLNHMMKSSQQNAVAAAFGVAGEPYEVHREGVFVTGITGGSRAAGTLKVGDVIQAVNGIKVAQTADFKRLMSGVKPGDSVEIAFMRSGAMRTEGVETISLGDGTGAGLGILPEDAVTVETQRKVGIEVADIGGPSAGLMLSLEILNQLMPEPISKGYKIAGTGSVDLEGNVGQIGGIQEKIVAAHRAEVDIFFAPADVAPGDSNTRDVQAEAERRGYDIKIVPVKTVQEAYDFLRSLPPRGEG
ncbi:SepM family pheromone-processing serine protease [Paenibacillus thermotolerans]|uniref:SepM family pheromone-processing serine protease n=1 Tax=Paenibacillus thermotolerans TaxID=3027807 RepID=UPI0023682EA6|nr:MULTISPECIES: SepM family pheromone-processing serine protease [unclassified Paenibacillus]